MAAPELRIASPGFSGLDANPNATTNQLSGYTHGNLISTGYTYDVENRLSFANSGAVQYAYDAQNKRVWQATCLTGYCTPGGTWLSQKLTRRTFSPSVPDKESSRKNQKTSCDQSRFHDFARRVAQTHRLAA